LPVSLVHEGEIDSLAGAIIMQSEAVVIDERTTRLMIEDWQLLRKLMQKKLHTRIDVDSGNLKKFLEKVKGIRIIRSTELAVVAYEKGVLQSCLPKIRNAKKELIDGVLWGIKLNGCSISREEIEKIVRTEG